MALTLRTHGDAIGTSSPSGVWNAPVAGGRRRRCSKRKARLPISDRDDASHRPAPGDSGRDRHRFDRRGGRYGTVREHTGRPK